MIPTPMRPEYDFSKGKRGKYARKLISDAQGRTPIMTTKTIIRAQGGTAEREVYLDDIQVPDMWHLYSQLEKSDEQAAQAVHEVWTLAHDLLRNLKERYIPK